MKTNNCPCSYRGAQKKFGTIDLQLTYDGDVIAAVCKASVRLVRDNHKMEARLLQASHFASVNPSFNNSVHNTYDWHVKRPLVLRCTLNHFNTIFNTTISRGSHDWQNPYHTHNHLTPSASSN